MKKIVYFILFLSCISANAQTGSEILLFDLSIKKGAVTLSKPKNISNHKGYDNQPFFHPSKPIIYYASFDDSGRSNIKTYNHQTATTYYLTVTREREYSPTVTANGEFISCIIQRDNGEQNLGQYPITGGEPKVLIKDLVIGYHAWVSNDQLLLFVLGDSTKPNSLHYYNIKTGTDTILANNIGRSLHKIPGTNAMSFVQQVTGKEPLIKKFDPVIVSITTICTALPGQDHLTWLNDHILIQSDGKTLFVNDIISNKGWQPVTIKGDLSLIKGISRLAVNKKSSKIALVVSE